MSPSGFRVGLRTHDDRAHLVGRNSTPRQRKGACVTATTTSVLVIFGIFGLTAFNLTHNKFGCNHFHAHVGDEVALSSFSDDLSAKFCSEYKIHLWDRSHMYLLPSTARVNTTQHRQEHFQIRYARDSMILNSRGFYLLPNSSLDVTGCRMPNSGDAPVEMVLFQGDYFGDHDHHWQAMKKNEHVVQRVEIPRDVLCNESSPNTPRLEYVVTQADTYYVILMERSHTHGHLSSGDVVLNGTLNRSVYDVSGATAVCSDRFECQFSLDFDNDDVDIVILINDNPMTPMPRSSVDTLCEARVMFWVGIFGMIPLVIVATILPFWVWLFCVKLPSRDRAVSSQTVTPQTTASAETGRLRSRSCPAERHDGGYGSLVEKGLSIQDGNNS